MEDYNLFTDTEYFLDKWNDIRKSIEENPKCNDLNIDIIEACNNTYTIDHFGCVVVIDGVWKFISDSVARHIAQSKNLKDSVYLSIIMDVLKTGYSING